MSEILIVFILCLWNVLNSILIIAMYGIHLNKENHAECIFRDKGGRG